MNDELRPEYDETSLVNGVRGKYADRYRVAVGDPSEDSLASAADELFQQLDVDEDDRDDIQPR